MKSCSSSRFRHSLGQIFFLSFATVLCLTSVAAQEKQAQPEKEQSKTVLPGAPGKDTFVQVCSGCHSPENVVGKGFNEDGWTQVVGAMVDHGAQISDDQFTTIVKCLTTAFPPIPTKINVNKAPADDLEHRLGITSKEAQNIVTFRQQNGDLKSIDDLKHVPDLDFSKIEVKKNLLTFKVGSRLVPELCPYQESSRIAA